MRNFTTLILTLLLTLCGATTAQAQTFVTYAETSTPASEITTGLYVIKAKYKDCTPRWMYAKTTVTSGKPSNIFFSETLSQNNLDNVWRIEKRDDGSFYMMHLGTATYLCLGYSKGSEDANNNNNCHLTLTNDKSAATYCSARSTFTDANGRKMDENAFVISAGAPSSTGNRHHFVIYNGDMGNCLSSWADAIGNESVNGTQVQFDFFKAELDYTALQQSVPTMSEGCTYYLQGANGYYVTSSASYTNDQSQACPFYVKKTDDNRFELYTSNGESHCTISDRLYIVTKTNEDYKKVYFSINPVSGTEYFTINNFNTSGTALQYMQNGTSGNVGKGTNPAAETARWKFVPANDAATAAASLTANVQSGDAVHGNVTTFSASYPVAIPTGYKAYTANYDKAANVINMTELSGSVIPANTGVLLRGEVNASLSIKPTMQSGTAVTGNVLTAVGDATKTFDTSTYTQIYLLGKSTTDGTLCFRHMSTSGTQTISAHKAYINLAGLSTESLATLRIRFDGETTGISSATIADTTDEAIYDLSGRRISHPTHGIYIKGGKKVIF